MGAERSTVAQRLGVFVLRRAGDGAAHSRPGDPSAADTVVVAEWAATSKWRGVGVARATPNVALSAAVRAHPSAAHARVLRRMVVAAEALAAPKETGDSIRAHSMHPAPPTETPDDRAAKIVDRGKRK